MNPKRWTCKPDMDGCQFSSAASRPRRALLLAPQERKRPIRARERKMCCQNAEAAITSCFTCFTSYELSFKVQVGCSATNYCIIHSGPEPLLAASRSAASVNISREYPPINSIIFRLKNCNACITDIEHDARHGECVWPFLESKALDNGVRLERLSAKLQRSLACRYSLNLQGNWQNVTMCKNQRETVCWPSNHVARHKLDQAHLSGSWQPQSKGLALIFPGNNVRPTVAKVSTKPWWRK